MNDKHQFKQKVLMWLGLHNLYPAKVKVFNTKRNGFEVRVYCPPMIYTTNKISYRKKDWEILEKDEDGRIVSFRKHGSIGHTIKLPMYIHINQNNFSDVEEQKYIVQMIKDSAILK